MSPSQFRLLYLNLRVDVASQMSNTYAFCTSRTYNVSIRKYRNGDMNANAAERGRVTSTMRRNHYISADRTAVARAFNGKATVNQCKRAVKAIIELGFTSTNLQGYCDTYLGLDCSGFVNNYFLRVYGRAERNIRSYYQQGQNRLRTSYASFRSKDVLIWCNSNGQLNSSTQHIAIIDHVREGLANELHATVIESTGGLGLIASIYRFRATSRPGVYAVFRPLKPSTRNHVRVVPVI